jgi:hypothetical protein
MTDTPKLNLVPVTEPSVAVAPSQPMAPAPAEAGPSANRPRAKKPAVARQRAQSQGESPPVASPWREWSSFDRTVSYRLPPELLAELEDRLWDLRLPVGVTVAAAIADLLDKPNEELLKLVERAEEAKPRRRPRTAG